VSTFNLDRTTPLVLVGMVTLEELLQGISPTCDLDFRIFDTSPKAIVHIRMRLFPSNRESAFFVHYSSTDDLQVNFLDMLGYLVDPKTDPSNRYKFFVQDVSGHLRMLIAFCVDHSQWSFVTPPDYTYKLEEVVAMERGSA
jgi:hypothetical protein